MCSRRRSSSATTVMVTRSRRAAATGAAIRTREPAIAEREDERFVVWETPNDAMVKDAIVTDGTDTRGARL